MFQHHVKPFKYRRNNRLETLCNFVLMIIIGFVNGTEMKSNHDDWLIDSLFILMMCPPALCLYELYRIIKHLICGNISASEKIAILTRKYGDDTDSEHVKMVMEIRNCQCGNTVVNASAINEDVLQGTQQLCISQPEDFGIRSGGIIKRRRVKERKNYLLMDELSK